MKENKEKTKEQVIFLNPETEKMYMEQKKKSEIKIKEVQKFMHLIQTFF